MQHIGSLPTEQVSAFISHKRKNRALTILVKQLNTTLLNGQKEQRQAARIALEKLGFIDI